MTELTQDRIRELFDYRDGELYWKIAKSWCIKIGDRAGGITHGYRRIGINGKRYYAHRLIFQYHHDDDIPEFLDHIDCNKLNNDINNLRPATKAQNAMNSKKNKSYNGKLTSSIYKGVYRDKRRDKWWSQIRSHGKNKFLGYFDSEIEAAIAYNKAAIERDGEFAKLNIILKPQ